MTLEEKRDATRIEHMHDAIARIAIIMGSLEKEDFVYCQQYTENGILLA